MALDILAIALIDADQFGVPAVEDFTDLTVHSCSVREIDEQLYKTTSGYPLCFYSLGGSNPLG